MVIYMFRGIRSTSHCSDELWLFIYSELLGALLSVLMSYGYLYIQRYLLGALLTMLMSNGYLYVQRYYGHSLCADELWLFIYSEVLGGLLSVLMS